MAFKKRVTHLEAAAKFRQLIVYLNDNPDESKRFLFQTGIYHEDGKLSASYRYFDENRIDFK